jgi:hypothetical protein
MKNWFEIDRTGLAKILARRGKEFALFELIQNAWDEPGVSNVAVVLEATKWNGYSRLQVVDDAPDGFKNLTHAYTLFAESNKKANAEQRGRFNLGEKLVLALAREARVVSTTGGVRFDKSGRHSVRTRRPCGSEIDIVLRINKDERERTLEQVRRLIPPAGVVTTINGEQLYAGTPVTGFDATLPTEIADAVGNLVPTRRQTNVRVFEATLLAPAAIYEMGIPVAELDGPYRLDVGQKIPLTLDRENVREGFRRALATAAFNALHQRMNREDMNATWAKEAVENPDAKQEAVSDFVKARFGDKVVSFDPSDPEANKLATSGGYTVLPGGTFSAAAWENVRATGLVKPAGQVTPSARVWDGENDPEAKDCPAIPECNWTAGMKEVASYAKLIAHAVLNVEISVVFYASPHMVAEAAFGQRELALNKFRLGNEWFDLSENRLKIDALLIHEFGHHFESDHLSESYYDALTSIAAKFIAAVRKGQL